MAVKLIVNHEFNGLELYFPDKPDEAILSMLRNAKWRYHRVKKCWYAKQTPENKALAEKLSGTIESEKLGVEEPFYPAYEKVGSSTIFRTADVSCWEHDEGYFADINAYMLVRSTRIIIIDLRNALIPGKECDRLVLECEDPYSSQCLYSGLDTFRAVYDRYFIKRELPDCKFYWTTTLSIRTFTPFKKIKPIKTPEKWTIPHVWKAILSGQIYQGNCDGRYTDDYAYDAAVGFREGVELHLPSFASDLIESPDGWRIYPGEELNGTIPLSVNCYHFNLNTLFYEEACDWPENTRRKNQREEERKQHNADMKAQLLSEEAVLEKTKSGMAFHVTLLEMNQNTDRYFAHKEVMLRPQFLDGERLWREILAIEPLDIANTGLYEIVCGSYIRDDKRIILNDDRCIVTGKALKELLSEHEDDEQIASVDVRHQSLAELRESLEKQRSGQIRKLFCPTPVRQLDTALTHLTAEEERLYDV